MIVGESLDVLGVVEVAVPFGFDKTRVVLAEALETPTSWRRDVCLPVRSPHQTSSGYLDENPAVDDRDEVRVRDEVKDMARPRSVDTREQNVAVKRGEKAIRFHDGDVEGLDLGLARGRAQFQLFGRDVDLRSADVPACCVHEPVEVVALNSIEVDEPQVLDSGPGKCLGDKRSHASESDDTDA
jgi:hypothetical protein